MRYSSIVLAAAGLFSGLVAAQPSDAPLKTLMPEPIYAAVQKSSQVQALPEGALWSNVENAHYDALTPDGKQLLVSGFKTGKVYLLDVASGKITKSFNIGKVAQGVKVSPDGRYGIGIAAGKGEMAVIDLESQEVVKTIKVGDTPHNAGFSADGKLAYVTLQGTGAIAVVDMQTLEKTHEIATPGLDTPHNLDIGDDGRHLWIRDFVGQVGVLDLQDEKMIKLFQVGNGHGGIDVIPDSHYVATGAIADTQVMFIDTERLEKAASVEVGSGPHGVRASADGHYLYAAMTGDDSIAVIDTQSFEVVRQAPLDGSFPFWIAVPGNR